MYSSIFIGIALLIVLAGICIIIPGARKISRCSKKTDGWILDIQRKPGGGDSSLKAYYSYTVDGVDYEGNTGWVDYGHYSVGGKCTVTYNERKPEESYISSLVYVIRMIVGAAFVICGMAAAAVIILLKL